MSLVGKLIGFGFRQAIGYVAGNEAGEMAGTVASSVIQAVEKHFTDNSTTLLKALTRANNHAWQALRIALADDGLLDKLKGLLGSGDYKGIREQVRLLLQDKGIDRKKCLNELNEATKAGLLKAQNLSPMDVVHKTADFQPYANSRSMVDGAMLVMGIIADELGAMFPNLAGLLRQPTPGDGRPLLVVACAYFFRREVVTNDELRRGLVFDGLRQLSVAQDKAFAEINKALI